jgi:hypothetical protein
MIDVAFRKIKGGQASTGPHHINPLHTTMTRQRSRYKAQRDEYKKVREEFDLPRRISRSIARARCKRAGIHG